MPITRRQFGAAGAALGLAAALPQAALAQPTRPLLMPGKRTLFQRVLTRPGAVLLERPGGSPRGPAPRAFDVLYVFERRSISGADWLLVGAARNGPPLGWLPEERTIAWKQTIAVAFSNRAGRERSLVFSEPAAIERLMGDPRGVAELRDRAMQGAVDPRFPVIAMEPDAFVDIRRRFYLLPILNRRTITRGGREVQALRVASVAKPPEGPPPAVTATRPFRTGIVFVIDTTISMQPFIERTREAIRRVYRQVQGSSISRNLGFGLVAFRNSTEITPALEYVTRTFVRLAPDQDPLAVLGQLSAVREARVSSHDHREDAYAGISEAITGMDWEPFDGRFVILITDSGPLPANDRSSSTRLDATALSDLARSRGVSLAVLHLITRVNQRVYSEARPAFRTLSAGIGSDRSPRYYEIPNGSPDAFSDAVTRMTSAMVQGLEAAAANRRVQPSAAPEDAVVRNALLDTLAMQLAAVGRQEGTNAPDIIDGWLADRALERPELAAVDVQVLMTKNELSTLRSVLSGIIDGGMATALDPGEFFNQIRSALAVMARDPTQLVNPEFRTLGEAMGEFLDDLPYRSEIQDIGADEWVAKPRAEQREILDRLSAKLRAFDRFHDDPTLWTALHAGAPPGETVFPLPLSSLP